MDNQGETSMTKNNPKMAIYINYQLKEGNCIYPPILIQAGQGKKAAIVVSAECQKIKEKLQIILTKYVLKAIKTKNYSDTMLTVDLRNENKKLPLSANFWISTLDKYWKNTGKIKFILPGKTYVIASTMLYTKYESEFQDTMDKLWAKQCVIYYLCIECLLHGRKNNFLSKGITNHRKRVHGFLANNCTFNFEHDLAEFSIRDLRASSVLNPKFFDDPQTPPQLWTRVSCNNVIKRELAVTLRLFQRAIIIHKFRKIKPKKKSPKKTLNQNSKPTTESAIVSQQNEQLHDNRLKVVDLQQLFNHYRDWKIDVLEFSPSTSSENCFEEVLNILQTAELCSWG